MREVSEMTGKRRSAAKKRAAGLHVGTSGWVYKGWAGEFYPPRLAQNRQLQFYAEQFGSVEINATFYRLPSEKMVQGWHDKAPEGFIYAAKGSRYITQFKKLNVEPESVALFFERIAPLKEHLGPILWQCPPNFHLDLPRLEKFLKQLPPRFRHAFEFRHPSWCAKEVYDLLKRHDAAWVSVSSQRMPMDLSVTTDFVYIRFHGLENGAAHDYTGSELKPWAEHCRVMLRKGAQVYAYFNNDANVRAPKNARELEKMVEEI
jgi:uncharacterized protein YecE (DUF72 family)